MHSTNDFTLCLLHYCFIRHALRNGGSLLPASGQQLVRVCFGIPVVRRLCCCGNALRCSFWCFSMDVCCEPLKYAVVCFVSSSRLCFSATVPLSLGRPLKARPQTFFTGTATATATGSATYFRAAGLSEAAPLSLVTRKYHVISIKFHCVSSVAAVVLHGTSQVCRCSLDDQSSLGTPMGRGGMGWEGT